MPTYEYHCDGCEHHFDEFQSINDQPLKKCPQSNRSTLRRTSGTGAAVIWKGLGSYQTDHRNESFQKAAKAEQESAKAAATDKAASNGKPHTGTKETSASEQKSTKKTPKATT